MKIKPVGKAIILIIVIGVAFGLYRMLTGGGGAGGNLISNLLPQAQTVGSSVPLTANLPVITDAAPAQPLGDLKMPTTAPFSGSGPEVRYLGYEWNAQMGLMFANGGVETTEGSLMAKEGVKFKIGRQDDNDKLQQALVAFANELSQGNAQPQNGAHFISIMGDGSATFLAGLNDQLKKYGPDYLAKIVTATGFSRGEDKFMGPPEWKTNPHAAMGGVVAGVIRDGDWNIAQKWLSDNGLKTNPDEKTYDPDALNWVSASDYIDAGTKYITGYSEDRPVVRNGKKTGETKHITVQGVVTWTPGDVNVATQRGGIVPIVSTREYSAQMPCVVIGIDKWCKANRSTVEGMIRAINRGGDAVKSSSDALMEGAKVSTEVYKDQNADYWVKYYKGDQATDKTGLSMSLGGSSVNNLADNMLLFGLVPGSASTFAADYQTFGDIVKAQYPSLVPNIAPANQVVDTSYLQDVAKSDNFEAAQVGVKPISKDVTPRIISTKSWHIPFETGRAAISPSAEGQLEKLLRDLLVAGSTVVEIHGHTDSQGNADANMKLSEGRAFAVKTWLEHHAPTNFPEGRIKVFAHGQTEPVAPNDNEAGRAKNRRVEIKIGATN